MLSQNLSLKVQIPMDMVILLWMNMFVNNRENLQLKPALKKILKKQNTETLWFISQKWGSDVCLPRPVSPRELQTKSSHRKKFDLATTALNISLELAIPAKIRTGKKAF